MTKLDYISCILFSRLHLMDFFTIKETYYRLICRLNISTACNFRITRMNLKKKFLPRCELMKTVLKLRILKNVIFKCSSRKSFENENHIHFNIHFTAFLVSESSEWKSNRPFAFECLCYRQSQYSNGEFISAVDRSNELREI